MKIHSRIAYTLILVAVIGLGLLSRQLESLPLATGDALWAAMIFFMVRWLLPSQRLLRAFGVSLVICWGVELSQLYQADWLNAIRATTLGALVLGHGFLWTDMLAYVIGCMGAAFAEWGVRARVKRVK